MAGVDSEVDHSQQRGEGVDRRGALGAHVITRCQQHLDGGADTVVSAWLAQLRILERERCSSDAARVERVGLSDASVGAGVHARGLDDRVSGIGCGARQACSVGAGALDHPEHAGIAVGASSGPGDSS
jgi:hypothetical protein